MNFLAHLYLSGNNSEVLIGNFLADAVKGKKAILQFPEQVQKGIIIHRDIDFYMDTHPIVKQGMSRLRENYPKFSGVIMDIFYDHFLAKNWADYSDIPLADYIESFYKLLRDNTELLPHNIQKMAPIMMEGNWLLIYADLEGIDRVLGGMNRRTKNKSGMDKAGHELRKFYSLFEADFKVVMKDLQKLSNDFLAP